MKTLAEIGERDLLALVLGYLLAREGGELRIMDGDLPDTAHIVMDVDEEVGVVVLTLIPDYVATGSEAAEEEAAAARTLRDEALAEKLGIGLPEIRNMPARKWKDLWTQLMEAQHPESPPDQFFERWQKGLVERVARTYDVPVELVKP